MLNDLWKYLKGCKKPIVLYGMGNGADKIIAVLENCGINISGVFASDEFVRNKYFHGFKIHNYSYFKEKYDKMTVLVCFGSSRIEVIENINRIAFEQELYAPDVPVYGDGLFDTEYVNKNKLRLENIYSMLADDISRQTFESIIKYRISGDIKYLYECEAEESEVYGDFLHLGDYESFIDLGAYNGDTIKEFCNITENRYAHIYAVEPDKKSFKKLKDNTSNLKKITLYNACVSSDEGIKRFAMRGGRNSALSAEGNAVPSISVDAIAKDRNITLLKADVEGEELNMIAGAKNTIMNQKPKMKIACYHRTGDIMDIPEAVLKIRKDYKIYMRHFRYIPAWDTYYYFI